MNLTKQFFKYVSQNIFGLLGTSCYILADTYFIAQAAGTDGVTLLTLCLPIYNLIFAFGSMIGLGAATRYAILRAQGDAQAQRYFSNAIFSVCILAVPFMLVGIFRPDGLLRLMGGDADIVALGMNYARIFLMFTPFFMCNYVVASFVRNDGDPSLAMVATLSGSLCNVVCDYIFMFPLGLGLAGAALVLCVLCYAGEWRINRWTYEVPAGTAQQASALNDALAELDGRVLLIPYGVRQRDRQLIETYVARDVYIVEYETLLQRGALAAGVLDLTAEAVGPEYPGRADTDLDASDWVLAADGVPVDTTTLEKADAACPAGYVLYRNLDAQRVRFAVS